MKVCDKAAPGAVAQALPLWREAVRLKPDYWIPYNNIMFAQVVLGNEDGVVQTARQMAQAAGGRPGRAPEIAYQNVDMLVGNLQPMRAALIADMRAHGGIGTTTLVVGPENLQVADFDAQLHDLESAALRLAVSA